jgi:hypothetical protein
MRVAEIDGHKDFHDSPHHPSRRRTGPARNAAGRPMDTGRRLWQGAA